MKYWRFMDIKKYIPEVMEHLSIMKILMTGGSSKTVSMNSTRIEKKWYTNLLFLINESIGIFISRVRSSNFDFMSPLVPIISQVTGQFHHDLAMLENMIYYHSNAHSRSIIYC